ncbi:MAG: hypothetical protein V7K41_05595 [Nostoc sp.]|uniref:hypothetical protein n=1 Tax=Nostoc sp. TaxID=1180 RepID=UPI002FF5C901
MTRTPPLGKVNISHAPSGISEAIAHRLHISLRAVQNHIQHLKVKLGIDEVEQKDINSRIALCMKAIQKKLLSF